MYNSSPNSLQSSSLPAAHMRLFEREIVRSMKDQDFINFTGFLTYEQKQKLYNLWENEEKRFLAKRYAFILFSFIPESAGFFEKIIKDSGKILIKLVSFINF